MWGYPKNLGSARREGKGNKLPHPLLCLQGELLRTQKRVKQGWRGGKEEGEFDRVTKTG